MSHTCCSFSLRSSNPCLLPCWVLPIRFQCNCHLLKEAFSPCLQVLSTLAVTLFLPCFLNLAAPALPLDYTYRTDPVCHVQSHTFYMQWVLQMLNNCLVTVDQRKAPISRFWKFPCYHYFHRDQFQTTNMKSPNTPLKDKIIGFHKPLETGSLQVTSDYMSPCDLKLGISKCKQLPTNHLVQIAFTLTMVSIIEELAFLDSRFPRVYSH